MTAQPNVISLEHKRTERALFGNADANPSVTKSLTRGLWNFCVDVQIAHKEMLDQLLAERMPAGMEPEEWRDFRRDLLDATAEVNDAVDRLKEKIALVGKS